MKFKVGDKIKHLRNGSLGVVVEVRRGNKYPVKVKLVKFPELDVLSYSHNGTSPNGSGLYIKLLTPLEELL